jgi:cytochrome c oxidase subunit 3
MWSAREAGGAGGGSRGALSELARELHVLRSEQTRYEDRLFSALCGHRGSSIPVGLQLSTGIYGSTFFMLTGFHGLHVTLGAIMLVVIWFRTMKGHFTPQRHFGFEAVAWYWHFVDVVWLGLFVFVYWV